MIWPDSLHPRTQEPALAPAARTGAEGQGSGSTAVWADTSRGRSPSAVRARRSTTRGAAGTTPRASSASPCGSAQRRQPQQHITAFREGTTQLMHSLIYGAHACRTRLWTWPFKFSELPGESVGGGGATRACQGDVYHGQSGGGRASSLPLPPAPAWGRPPRPRPAPSAPQHRARQAPARQVPYAPTF